MTKITCCYNCSERTVGCHSKCEKYSNYLDGLREYKEKVYEQTAGDRIHSAYTYDLYNRLTNMKQYRGCRFKSRSI